MFSAQDLCWSYQPIAGPPVYSRRDWAALFGYEDDTRSAADYRRILAPMFLAAGFTHLYHSNSAARGPITHRRAVRPASTHRGRGPE